MEGFHFNAETGCLRIDGEFTVYQASAAHEVLLNCCRDGKLNSLDLSGVSEFDCAAIQLLLGLRKMPAAAQVRIIKASEPVRAALNILQLHELLSDSGEALV